MSEEATEVRTPGEVDTEYTVLCIQVGDMVLKTVGCIQDALPKMRRLMVLKKVAEQVAEQAGDK